MPSLLSLRVIMLRRSATYRLKGIPLGSWFDELTTSGRDPVRP